MAKNNYTLEEISSWPSGHKRCNKCNALRPLGHFPKSSRSLLGVKNICTICQKSTGVFSGEDMLSWPEGHRGCITCKRVKPFSEFHKSAPSHRVAWPVVSSCKDCKRKRDRDNWEEYSRVKKERLKNDKSAQARAMITSIRNRCNRKGIEFSITADDIVIPDLCPVLGVPLVRGHRRFAPSVDRIDPNLGYVPGNVMVVSNIVNTMKNNASQEELRMFCKFYASGRPSGI